MLACPADGTQTPPAAEGTFGTADGEVLVLAGSDAPKGMDHVAEVSGPQSVYQFVGERTRVARLQDLGARGGYVQRFAVDVSPYEPPEPAKLLNATTLLCETLLFPDDESAAMALSFLRANPNPLLEEVEIEDVPAVASGAYIQRSKRGRVSNAAYYWQADNALVRISAQTASGEPSEDGLLKVARELVRRIASAQPSGDEIALPERPTRGPVILEDTFEDDRGWDLAADGEEKLTRYLDGGLQVAIAAAGARWIESSDLPDESLDSLADAIVEIDATHVGGRPARWGVQCRLTGDGGFYLFVIGTDGFAGIFSASAGAEEIDEMAATNTTALGEAVARRHRLRAECSGDPLVRLALYVDGDLILEAYDDDPRPPGAVGMWIEARTGAAAALFDNLKVSHAVAG